MPAAVWGVCVCWCFLSTEAILLSIRYWLGCQPSSAEDLTAVPNAWPLGNGAKNWWQEAPKCKYHQDDVLDVWKWITIVNDYVLALLSTISKCNLFSTLYYTLLHFVKSKMHNGIFKICLCVRVHIYIFIVWIYLCFHGCSCWCWRWWSSDSFWYQSSVYLLYIKVYIYTNLYLHHILVYIFFQFFLNRTKSESF